ncbi:MAG: hypothetical protein AAB344_05850, partial [Bacteroidota bacterium]
MFQTFLFTIFVSPLSSEFLAGTAYGSSSRKLVEGKRMSLLKVGLLITGEKTKPTTMIARRRRVEFTVLISIQHSRYAIELFEPQ